MLYRVKVEHLVNVNNLGQIEGVGSIFEDAKIRGAIAYKVCEVSLVECAEKEKLRNYLGYQLFRDHGIK